MEQNVIYNIRLLGLGLISKGRNHFFNDIVACPMDAVKRGMFSIELDGGTNRHAGSLAMYNMYVAHRTDQPFVNTRVLLQGKPEEVYKVSMDHNLFFHLADANAAGDYLQWAHSYGQEESSVCTDPMFEDVLKGDFRLKPGSPLKKLGFNPLAWNPDDWPSLMRRQD